MRSLSVLIFVAACAHRGEPPSPDLNNSDIAIYRLVLDSMFVTAGANRTSQLVLRDSTHVLNGGNLVRNLMVDFSRLPGIDTSAVRDFATRGLESQTLKELRRIGLRIPVVLIDRQVISSLPRQNPDQYWSQFYQRYPGSSGIIELYPIGYSTNGDLAVTMVDQGCGSLCGNGYVVAFRRMAGSWRIVAIQQTWIS